MDEIELKWRIKKTKKANKKFPLYYISVKPQLAISLSLLNKQPFLDPQNMIIFFISKNDIVSGNLIKLRWRIKKMVKAGKEYLLCYISVPARSALFLLDKEPFLDLQRMIIFFRPKQNDPQQSSTQNQQPQSQ